MIIDDFAKPTILKGTQYGTTITIELDHSDTSIDEVMDGMLTIIKGLGYLDFTINEWIKDKSRSIYEDEHNIVTNALIDEDILSEDDIMDWNNVDERRMDIIGQNGNEGTHYLATDADMEECELNERQLTEYKGIYIQQPAEDLVKCWCGEKTMCNCISEENDNDEDYKGQFKDWESETPTDENEFDDYGQRIPKGRVTFEWGDTPEDDEPLFDEEMIVPNKKLTMAAKKYSDELKQKHVPIKEQKVLSNEVKLGKWQTDNKTKKVVKLDKSIVRKGKIKDLKK